MRQSSNAIERRPIAGQAGDQGAAVLLAELEEQLAVVDAAIGDELGDGVLSVVAWHALSTLTLIVTGTPCSAPGAMPAASAASQASAVASAASANAERDGAYFEKGVEIRAWGRALQREGRTFVVEVGFSENFD